MDVEVKSELIGVDLSDRIHAGLVEIRDCLRIDAEQLEQECGTQCVAYRLRLYADWIDAKI